MTYIAEENGLFNEFGALDPGGLPIEAVLAAPIVEIPQVIQPQEAALWTNVPILQHDDTRSGRRNDKTESMIPKFLGRATGHHNIPPNLIRECDPMDILLLFLDEYLIGQFVKVTNYCAEQWGTRNWKILSAPEFILFVVIIIFMGKVRLPERAMYWQRNDYGQKLPMKYMSARRFEMIMAHWHWLFIHEDERKQGKQ
jgi:Transposase IS4